MDVDGELGCTTVWNTEGSGEGRVEVVGTGSG